MSGSRTADLFGDPADLAAHQFRLALELCADCRDYHAVWPYRRLSRTVSGIEATADIVKALLRDVTPRGGQVLIAGSADAGMLALAAQAAKTLAPQIVVADRCATPLAVCRRYAETHGLSIATLQTELGGALQSQSHDVVFADGVLQFMPRQSHAAVLRKLRGMMSARGALVLVERVRTSGEGGSPRADGGTEVVKALATQGVALPEDEATFVLRLNGMLMARQKRFNDCSAEDLERSLAEAGFRIRSLEPDQQQRIVILQNGDRVKMRIVVATHS